MQVNDKTSSRFGLAETQSRGAPFQGSVRGPHRLSVRMNHFSHEQSHVNDNASRRVRQTALKELLFLTERLDTTADDRDEPFDERQNEAAE
jgi:hypothetical protein